MPAPFRIALLGLHTAERRTFTEALQRVAPPRFVVAPMLSDADFFVADAEDGPSERLVRDTDHLDDTVFVGGRAPEGAVAWLPRPLDPAQVLRALDKLARRRRSDPAASRARARAGTPRPVPDVGLGAAPASASLATADAAGGEQAGGTAVDAPIDLTLDVSFDDALEPSAEMSSDRASDITSEATTAAPPDHAPGLPPPPPSDLPPLPVIDASTIEGDVPPLVLDLREPPGESPPAQPSVSRRRGPPRPPAASPSADTPTPEPPAPPTAPAGPRALLVDDSEIALRYLERLLTELGLHSDRTTNSADALALLARRDYDIVFLDMELGSGSDLDGLALARRVKVATATRVPPAPVVMVTAHHSELDRARAMLAGCDAFLGKPLQGAELQRVLTRQGLAVRVGR